jgi:hypothetical protein
MFKTIAIVVVVLLVSVLLFAATEPDTFRIERSTLVKAQPERIFPLINDLHSFNTWNPYERKDPNMKGSYSGPASGPGATYSFVGNNNVGSGNMEITASTAPSQVTLRLNMLKPFEGHNIVEFSLEPQGNETAVTWAMHGPSPYIAKIMGLVFNMDRMVGQDFEAGLVELKAIAEK